MAVLRGSETFVEKTNYEQLIKAASVVQGFKDADRSPEIYEKELFDNFKIVVNFKTENHLQKNFKLLQKKIKLS